MKQILEKLSGQIPNAINSLFFLLFGASIVVLFGQVVDAWLNYPFPLAACCGLSFVTGVAAHRFYASLPSIETKKSIRSLSDRRKALLLEMYLYPNGMELSPFGDEGVDANVLRRMHLISLTHEDGISRTYQITKIARETIARSEKLYRELGQTYIEYYSLDKEQPNENESELAKDSEPADGNQKVG